MTSFGPESVDQVSELAGLLRRRLGRADTGQHPSTAHVRNLMGEAGTTLAAMLRTEQRLAGQRAYVRAPRMIGIDQGAVSGVARARPSDFEREGLLVGALMRANREVARKLLMLVDERYLLNPETARTWRGARQALVAGAMLRPPVLGAVEHGISADTLTDLRRKHQGLDVDAVFANGRLSATIGLHRHALVTAGGLAVLAKRGDEPIQTMLRTAIDAVHTVDVMAGRIEQSMDAVGRRAAAGQRQPLDAALKALHDQGRPSSGEGSSDEQSTDGAAGGVAAESPAQRLPGREQPGGTPRRKP